MLEGIRILEVANVITGPLAGMTLADLGADVIKVEPLSGDPFRSWDGRGGDIRPAFAAYNRGKRSIAIDLKSDDGREAFFALAAESDVVVENSRPGAMERMGLGASDLLDRNPRLVYCSISGMGRVGPEHQRPTFDSVALAMSGLWSQLTDLERPELVGPPMADQLTGLYAVIAILGALRERDRTGSGRAVEVNMLAACLAFQPAAVADYTREGIVATKSSRARNSQSYAFVASDTLPFAVHLSTPHKFWVGLCTAVGRPEWAADPRFEAKGQRIDRYAELQTMFSEIFLTEPRDHWLERLREQDVPAAPLLTVGQAIESPQVQAMEIIAPVDTAGLGGLARLPVVVDGKYMAGERPPPTLGADTDAVLSALGWTAEKLTALRASGAVA